MARVMVTGGAGFIGSHIVDNMIADGHSVEVIDDLSSGFAENVPAGVPLRRLDIRSPEAAKALRDFAPDIVVHAAAQMSVRRSMEEPLFDTEVNVAGLVNLLGAFPAGKLPYFVFISTGGAIYGEQEHFPAREDHRISPESVYGLAKWVGERYLDLWSRQFGLRYCALRLANVYGPRQNPHGEAGVVAIFCQRLLRGAKPVINGSGEQTRDFVYVGDVAQAVRLVCAGRVSGTYNIGTGRETSVNELYRLISAAIGSTVAAERVPAKAGEQMRSSIDAAAAAKSFDWRPQVPLDRGLALTAEYFRTALR